MRVSYFNFAYETLKILQKLYMTRIGMGDKSVSKDYEEVCEAIIYLESKRK